MIIYSVAKEKHHSISPSPQTDEIVTFARRLIFFSVNSLPNDKILDQSKLKALNFCKRQNKCDLTTEICFGKGRIHCGNRRKCWLPAFSPFPKMFLNGLSYKVVKSCDCCKELRDFHSLMIFMIR